MKKFFSIIMIMLLVLVFTTMTGCQKIDDAKEKFNTTKQKAVDVVDELKDIKDRAKNLTNGSILDKINMTEVIGITKNITEKMKDNKEQLNNLVNQTISGYLENATINDSVSGPGNA